MLKRHLITLSLLLCMTCALDPSAQAGGFSDVGNGGGGIEVAGRFILSDFAKSGFEPYLDPSIEPSPLFTRFAYDFLNKNSVLRKTMRASLLSSFLTQTEARSRGLGRSVALALSQYSFLPARAALERSTDEPLSSQVPIAVRRLSRIFIDREAFERLDDLNRLGLIIHEAVYSLQRPACRASSSSSEFERCKPLSSIARLHTRLLFSSTSSFQSSKAVLALLDLPSRLDEISTVSWMRISVRSTTEQKTVVPILSGPLSLRRLREIERSLSFICDSKEKPELTIELRGLFSQRFLYRDTFGTQTRIRIQNEFDDQAELPIASKRNCLIFLSQKLRAHLADVDWL